MTEPQHSCTDWALRRLALIAPENLVEPRAAVSAHDWPSSAVRAADTLYVSRTTARFFPASCRGLGRSDTSRRRHSRLSPHPTWPSGRGQQFGRRHGTSGLHHNHPRSPTSCARPVVRTRVRRHSRTVTPTVNRGAVLVKAAYLADPMDLNLAILISAVTLLAAGTNSSCYASSTDKSFGST